MAAVAVIHGRLDLLAGEVERLVNLLVPDERAHAARFRFARDRRRFIVRRARLRQCLAAETGIAPERIVFTEGAFGKPALAQGPRFSLSHSGEHWVVAITDAAVGIDIEQLNPDIDHADIARGLFGPRECAALAALPEEEAMRGFFDCWARKEAFVKAIGQGLSYPLDAFEVSITESARLRAGGEGWAIQAFAFASDVAGAVVVQDDARPLTVRLRDFDALRLAANRAPFAASAARAFP